MRASAFLHLMRFHKPVGTVLLWLPVAWALWITNHGMPSIELLIIFFIGTLVMRSAGCVVNDIADRNIDKHVSRTRARPLASGDVQLVEAILLLVFLFFIAFLVVIRLPIACFYYAIVALGVTILYPFCKRFFEAPQLILGIAFSMGIPMVYVASSHALDWSFVSLFVLNFAWIVAYDTMYAMADKEDDLQIGVKSTAILFASYDRLIILCLQLFVHGAWIYIGIKTDCKVSFYIVWLMAIGPLVYQQILLNKKTTTAYFKAFLSNAWYGALMWIALIVGQ